MLHLVLVNLFRNKLRTVLTLASVFVALFLFSSLGAILDTFQAAADSGRACNSTPSRRSRGT